MIQSHVFYAAFGSSQTVLSEESMAARKDMKAIQPIESSARAPSSMPMSSRVGSINDIDQNKKRGMVLPFVPLSITFDDIKYAVDMPQVTYTILTLHITSCQHLELIIYCFMSGNES